MRLFFTRSTLSKKEQVEAKQAERPANIKFLLTLLLVPLVLLAYSLNFEVKLNTILAKHSQIDETDTLTTIDRLKINRQSRALKESTGIELEFYITKFGIQKPSPNEQNLFASINTQNNKIEVRLPFQNHSIEARLENNLKTCVHYDDMGTCLTQMVENLHSILTQNETPSASMEYKADFTRAERE